MSRLSDEKLKVIESSRFVSTWAEIESLIAEVREWRRIVKGMIDTNMWDPDVGELFTYYKAVARK